MTKPWRSALARFLEEVPFRKDIVGGLACGSFITGDPGPRSDVDLHLVLRPKTRWRERGNRIIDGVLVEYFANPPEQIRAYFREDHEDHSRAAQTQFATGRILFDHRGVVRRLVIEARAWHRRPFQRVSRSWIEVRKYFIFDGLDNLEEAAERGSPDVPYLHATLIGVVRDAYGRFLGEPVPSPAKAYRLATSTRARRKYLAGPPKDPGYVRLLAAAIRESNSSSMPRRARALVKHVHQRMGGFEIDGWRLRSKVAT